MDLICLLDTDVLATRALIDASPYRWCLLTGQDAQPVIHSLCIKLGISSLIPPLGREVLIVNAPSLFDNPYPMHQDGDSCHDARELNQALELIKPGTLEELMIAIAATRPGENVIVHEYVARRDQGKPRADTPEALSACLAPTQGMILYQEQIESIAHRIGGMALDETRAFRHALCKADPFAREAAERFVAGAMQRGVPAAEAVAICEHLHRYAMIAFNQCHALAMALAMLRAAQS